MALFFGFIGTYWSPQSHGVYRFTLDASTGMLATPSLYFAAKNAKCVCLSDNQLAAPAECDGHAGLVVLDAARQANAPLCQCLAEQSTCCFVAARDGLWYTANYHEGTVSVYRQSDTLQLIHRMENGAGAGCHQVLFHQNLMLVPCLELDEIRLFDLMRDYAPAGAIHFPKGAGPRHLLFNRAHSRLYTVTERSNALYRFAVIGASFTLLSRTDILAHTDNAAATAALRLSPDERFLYVSVRGANVITVFACTPSGAERVQQVPCGGRHPRDFVLSPDGRFVLVLNRDSNNLVCFARDAQTGLLGQTVSEVTVHNGSGIEFAPQ